jgi:hypothetical protein
MFTNISFFFIVILPKLAGFLAKRGMIEFFPMEPVGYLSDLTNQVIERRKKKLEVTIYSNHKV